MTSGMATEDAKPVSVEKTTDSMGTLEAKWRSTPPASVPLVVTRQPWSDDRAVRTI